MWFRCVFFFVLFCWQPDTNFHSATLNCTTCDVNSQKAVGTLLHGKCYGYCDSSLLYVKYIFFLFYRSIGFKENIKYAIKCIT